MLFLALHIAGNAVFGLLVKLGRGRRFDYPVVGLANYATAALVAVAALLSAHLPALDGRAALFGLVNGLQYQVSYLLMFVLIGRAGIAVTTSFMRLSVAVPVVASILFWREWPTTVQALGLLLAAIALPLLSGATLRRTGQAAQARVHSRASVAALVGATVLISGCGLLAAKAFAELGHPEQRPVYIATVYLAATLMSALAWPWRDRFRAHTSPGRAPASMPARRHPALLASLALGALVGLVNIGQIWALLPALAEVPGVIAFPVAAAGGLSLAALGGWLFWREPVGGRTGAGIALAVGAAALANAR